MSFIIQGVDLPKGYKVLHMRVQSNGVIRYLIEGDDPVHIIDDGAQAIQIPKDHGNIIDESKAIVTETIDGYYEITAPTIFEGEKDEFHSKRD